MNNPRSTPVVDDLGWRSTKGRARFEDRSRVVPTILVRRAKVMSRSILKILLGGAAVLLVARSASSLPEMMFSKEVFAAESDGTESAPQAPADSVSIQDEAALESTAPYTIQWSGFEMRWVPIPGGVTQIGSQDKEPGRKPDEGPAFDVAIEPFWMGQYEVTWDQFDVFRQEYAARAEARIDPASSAPGQSAPGSSAAEKWADAVSVPTPLWEQDSAPILAGLGRKGGYPVADISRFAARQFAKWLSRKTGHFYRLPTEAEWEHAARAGTKTPYFFGSDSGSLGEYAWTFDNSEYEDPDRGYPGFGAGYRKVGLKKPNPWGLYDIYGNVSEWVLDGYAENGYPKRPDAPAGLPGSQAIRWPTSVFPGVVRGGNWESDAEACRSAARLPSSRKWQKRDPQLPKSLWWYTDAFHVGFRLVRPVRVPSVAEQRRHWDPEITAIQRVLKEGAKQLRAPIEPAPVKSPGTAPGKASPADKKPKG